MWLFNTDFITYVFESVFTSLSVAETLFFQCEVSDALSSFLSPLQLLFDVCCVVLCRAYKTVQEEDLKFPLIYGEGKKVRRIPASQLTRSQEGHLRVNDVFK